MSAWLKCVYLRDRIGQTFEGLITTVVEFGAFVQLTAVGVDGLLHIESLRDDEYVMEPGGRAWVGRARKRRLGMGTRVHVIVDQRESHRRARGPRAGRSRRGRRAEAAEVAAQGASQRAAADRTRGQEDADRER